MKSDRTGGPAFPRSGYEYQDEEGGRLQLACDAADGMALRDWFAGQALPTVIHLSHHKNGQWDYAASAACAYEMADALLKAREGPPPLPPVEKGIDDDDAA